MFNFYNYNNLQHTLFKVQYIFFSLMDHSLVMAKGLAYSMKSRAMLCRAPQDGQVIVKSSNKYGPLKKEMTTHSSVHAWKIP